MGGHGTVSPPSELGLRPISLLILGLLYKVKSVLRDSFSLNDMPKFYGFLVANASRHVAYCTGR